MKHYKPANTKHYGTFDMISLEQCEFSTLTYCPDVSGEGRSWICDTCGASFTREYLLSIAKPTEVEA